MKKYIIGLLTGLIIAGTIGVYAAIKHQASEIGYNNGTVESALNDLYTKPTVRKFCELKSTTYGTAGNVGSMYECDPGDEVKRNFYILAVNGDKVDMIMQHNITEGAATTTMTWNNAMKYIGNNNLKSSWSNVLDVDLPKAQDIANAVGRTNWYAGDNNTWWCLETKQQDTTSSPYCYNNDGNLETLWLWDYTRECAGWNCQHSLGPTEAYGYWTRDLISNTANAWHVHGRSILGSYSVSYATYCGVRPVITVLKSNLYE